MDPRPCPGGGAVAPRRGRGGAEDRPVARLHALLHVGRATRGTRGQRVPLPGARLAPEQARDGDVRGLLPAERGLHRDRLPREAEDRPSGPVRVPASCGRGAAGRLGARNPRRRGPDLLPAHPDPDAQPQPPLPRDPAGLAAAGAARRIFAAVVVRHRFECQRRSRRSRKRPYSLPRPAGRPHVAPSRTLRTLTLRPRWRPGPRL
jgi:hypothetical protein